MRELRVDATAHRGPAAARTRRSVIVDVGAADEFAPGVVGVFDVNGREVCVVNVGDEWFGLRNICPHQTETLARGRVRPDVVAGEKLGDYKVTDRMLITCPRHCW